MRYLVSTKELEEASSYSPQSRAQYFLSRAIESEEVWGLNNPSGWILKEQNDQTILPIWPYQQMATGCAQGEWENYEANAVSLEHFVYKVLPMMVTQDILVEIFPTNSNPGELMSAEKLASIFEGLLESGEYYMEG